MPKKKSEQVEKIPVETEAKADVQAETIEETKSDAEPIAANDASSTESKSKASRKEVIAQRRANEKKRADKNAEREEALVKWEQIKTAKHEGRILRSRIISVEVLNNTQVVAVVKVNDFRVIIPCDNMFVDAPVDETTIETKDDKLKREKQMLTKLLGGEIPFIITELAISPDDKNGSDYAIIGSRKQAIEILANRNFNRKNSKGEYIINEGDFLEADVVSVGPHAVFVNVAGFDVSIPLFLLTHKYVSDARTIYSPGDKITVCVKSINRDKNNKFDSLTVSGKEAEIAEFAPRIKNISPGTATLGRITSIRESKKTPGKTIVLLFLEDLGVPAIANYISIDTITSPVRQGDLVVFSVYATFEDRGIVSGNITRKVKN